MASEMSFPDEGRAFAAGKDDAPKSCADIANFGDPIDLWQESYACEKFNSDDM